MNKQQDGKALVPTNDEGCFKTPNQRAPKVVRKVLDEDTFTQDLEKIIERDFFPDLPKLRAQLEYQQALEDNDVVKLRDLQLKYGPRLTTPSNGMTDCNSSPATFETPVTCSSRTPGCESTTGSTGGNPEKKKSGVTSENNDETSSGPSLDGYLARNTSEDNASFGLIMEASERKHRLKYSWLYDKELEHARFQRQALALPSCEDQAGDGHRVPFLDNWTYTNRNSLMYVPDGAEFTAQEILEMGKKQREIAHDNTRLERAPFNERVNRMAISEAAHLQARAKEGKIGVDGKEVMPVNPEGGVGGGGVPLAVGVHPDPCETPKIAGYGLVATPSPAPGVDDPSLMTWGEIEGTPFRLDGGDTPHAKSTGPSFRLQDVPARDRLAFELADKARQKHREKKIQALNTMQAHLQGPSPSYSSAERLASMSPAAQRLASARLGINLGSDRSLQLSYTPSPSQRLTRRKVTPRSTVRTRASARTPLAVDSASKSNADMDSSSLTDDLLKLPKRLRASDYFHD